MEFPPGAICNMEKQPDGSIQAVFVFSASMDVQLRGRRDMESNWFVYIGTGNRVCVAVTDKFGSIAESLTRLWKTDFADHLLSIPCIKLCSKCNRVVAMDGLCPDCRVARYCCRKCQKEDWPAHKGQRCSELLAGKLAQLDVRDGDEPHAPRGEGGAGA